jgi:hypothetical protein
LGGRGDNTSETSGEIAAIQQDLVNCTGANFRGERAPS